MKKKKVEYQARDGRYAMHKTRWKEMKTFQKFLLSQSHLAMKTTTSKEVETVFKARKGEKE